MAYAPLAGWVGSELDVVESVRLACMLHVLDQLRVGYCLDEWPFYALFHDTPLSMDDPERRWDAEHLAMLYRWVAEPRRWHQCTEGLARLNSAATTGLRLRPDDAEHETRG